MIEEAGRGVIGAFAAILIAVQVAVAQPEDASRSRGLVDAPVRVDTVILQGTVTSSLHEALVADDEGGIPSEERERIADLLAEEIFPWQVDLARDLREGDGFRILYQREVGPDGSLRDGHVLAAEMTADGREHHAYFFEDGDGTRGYFDAWGRSTRQVDPRTAIPEITGDPIPERYRTAFDARRAKQVATLDFHTEPILLARGEEPRSDRRREQAATGSSAAGAMNSGPAVEPDRRGGRANRSHSPRARRGPPFCRDGSGHPRHGTAWCAERGFTGEDARGDGRVDRERERGPRRGKRGRGGSRGRP